jgi:UDP-N-acetylglucosamine 2-epimerase (non-hydrolysing)
MVKNILFIFGTRPEAIKMAPLIRELRNDEKNFAVKVCVTAQHRQMLDQVTEFFQIKVDYDLDLMKNDQTLFSITSSALTGLESVLDHSKAEYVIVQGDTTSAFVGALAAYYKKIKVVHLEAGLRSGDKYSPFPEEMNRKLAGHLSDYHFAPTQGAADNLKKEGIEKNVFVTGNTVIDALLTGIEILKKTEDHKYAADYSFLRGGRMILVTSHRRESFGEPLKNICKAVKFISEKYPDVDIVYPVHLNPNVQNTVKDFLGKVANVHLINPVDYPHMLWLLNKAFIVLTDSGGIQEEAPSLGKPVLVLREVTERQEGIDAGTAKLVGTDEKLIIQETEILLNDHEAYSKMSKAVNPYGDGTTCKKIREILLR